MEERKSNREDGRMSIRKEETYRKRNEKGAE